MQIQSICWSIPRCSRFTLGEKTDNHFTGELLGLEAGMDGTKNLT
jgi:hypothetical protein